MPANEVIEALIAGEVPQETNRCPKCGSNRVKVDYPEITCMACGWSEPLIDYPISYREHREYHNNFHQMELAAEVPREPDQTIETRIDKIQNQVNILMGQSVYQQEQKKTGLQRINV